MDELLASGKTVVLNPGGVQECLYMQHDGSETVFLRKRQGFVRMAMKHGAPLVGGRWAGGVMLRSMSELVRDRAGPGGETAAAS